MSMAEAYTKFKKTDGEFSTEYIEWQAKYQRECSANVNICRCPPEPKGPTPPTLEDFKSTTGEAYYLSEILGHSYAERHKQHIMINRPTRLSL